MESDRSQAKCSATFISEQRRFHRNDMVDINLSEREDPKSCGRKRDKAKAFMAVKGPRMAGAAATIGMLIFNVVSCCG